jgi:hypothetical protein
MLSTVNQTSAVDPQTKVDHTITIILKNGFAERLHPMPELHFGETVQYITTEPGAKASMVFPDLSPYRTDDQTETEIPGLQITQLVRPFEIGEASFQGLCFLTLADGTRVGWNPVHPELGGGNHKVSKP